MIKEYIAQIQRYYNMGSATEHTYRPALHNLLSTLLPDLLVVHEAKRISCGAPDYIIVRKHDKTTTKDRIHSGRGRLKGVS